MSKKKSCFFPNKRDVIDVFHITTKSGQLKTDAMQDEKHYLLSRPNCVVGYPGHYSMHGRSIMFV